MFINARKSSAPGGKDSSRAVREGVPAGSLACLREGAQDAAPAREQIERVAATLATERMT